VDGQESPVDWMRVRRQASSQGKDRTEQNVIKLWIRMGVSRKQENSSHSSQRPGKVILSSILFPDEVTSGVLTVDLRKADHRRDVLMMSNNVYSNQLLVY
jgi:hypothetical protein